MSVIGDIAAALQAVETEAKVFRPVPNRAERRKTEREQARRTRRAARAQAVQQ